MGDSSTTQVTIYKALGDGRRTGEDGFHLDIEYGHRKLITLEVLTRMFKETLESIPLFQGLDLEDLKLLSERLETDSFSEGEVIFGQGDRADRLYVLISGRVAIQFKPEDGDTITVTEITEGGVFGWSSALGRTSYTSCAVCLAESEALSVLGDELRELCATHPETGVIILERLAEVIAARLRNTHAHVVGMLQRGMRTKDES
jgi:CRP/FNR family cyclic AMP-dependent transcriptional regulator